MPVPVLRVCLVAASELDRLAYRRLLEPLAELAIVAECGYSPTEVWTALRLEPSAAIVIAEALGSDRRDVISMIPRLRPDCRLMLVCELRDPGMIDDLNALAPDAIVLKSEGLDAVRRAIADVAGGGRHFSPALANVVAAGAGIRLDHAGLTRRESELLPLLARGMKLRDAAARMTVSYKTADSYRTSLLRKLGLRDRVELARFAIRERIIEA